MADFHMGALLNIRFGYRTSHSSGVFGLQPELLYSRQGFKTNDDNCTFSYLTLPIMCKFYVVNGLHIVVGPYFSYLLGVSPESIVVNGPKVVISGLKGGVDAGVCMGAGFDTKMGATFGIRYTLGLSQVANNLNWKNRVLSTSLGWMF